MDWDKFTFFIYLPFACTTGKWDMKYRSYSSHIYEIIQLILIAMLDDTYQEARIKCYKSD